MYQRASPVTQSLCAVLWVIQKRRANSLQDAQIKPAVGGWVVGIMGVEERASPPLWEEGPSAGSSLSSDGVRTAGTTVSASLRGQYAGSDAKFCAPWVEHSRAARRPATALPLVKGLSALVWAGVQDMKRSLYYFIISSRAFIGSKGCFKLLPSSLRKHAKRRYGNQLLCWASCQEVYTLGVWPTRTA